MSLTHDAQVIWRAGVAAVASREAVRNAVTCDAQSLVIAGITFPLSELVRIEIVGAGKAGAGMAAGLETALLPTLDPARISGWVNVPADCVRPLERIHLHPARPPGLNEPTPESVQGTNEILQRVRGLTSRDLCIVLLSGGASALLCSPATGITLSDKLAVTRALATSGAPIHQLNIVRTQLSKVKGGQLAAACHAGTMIALIISDVIGDPLDIIGSGPTIETPSRAEEALEILHTRHLADQIPASVLNFLKARAQNAASHVPSTQGQRTCQVHNCIVASNSIAMSAAAWKAQQLGYEVQSLGSDNAGDAATHGHDLMQQLRRAEKKVCLLSGGEPTVNLAGTGPAIEKPTAAFTSPKGGRNQELVLAAIAAFPDPADWRQTVLLSGGTDGEDGPTDAAGAFADAAVVSRMQHNGLDPQSFLATHNSWHFFAAVDSLLKTGPTHTNVMDLRVGLTDAAQQNP